MERTEIEQLGEFGLIRRLTQEIKHQQSSTLLGVGDDAAVIDSGDKTGGLEHGHAGGGRAF